MKDSQQYVLIETVTLRYVSLEMSQSHFCIIDNDSAIENDAHRSFQVEFNPCYNDLAILIHFKHLQISDLQLYYRKKKLRNKEGMGLGDAKLLSVIGFWFGWASIPFVIFFSSVIALLSVVPDIIKNKKDLSSQIPFGPYLIIGNLVFLIFNEQIRLFLN